MDSTGTTTFGYDGLSRLTSAAYPAGYGTWSWTYDEVGNRKTQIAPSGTTTYVYDDNNRLTSAGGVNYTYDANGNLKTTTAGQSFDWDVFNRMTSATGPGGTATYTYNGDSLKIRRIGPDGTTRYYHDGIRPIWETDGAGSMTAQLDRDIFGNLLSRKEPAGTRRHYHFDGLGSTTALSDEGGAAVATLLYDAWGNQRAATGGPVPNYRFTGAELDTASGLYHMGARFYDPTIGRWLSEDPVRDRPFDPQTLNLYSYVLNNPVLFTDPSGKDVQETVKELIKKYGIAGALQRLRELWALLDKIRSALRDRGIEVPGLTFSSLLGGVSASNSSQQGGAAGYLDINITLGYAGVNITGGRIQTSKGDVHWYLGVAFGTLGVSVSVGIPESITPGLYWAAGGGFIISGQFGSSLMPGCASGCWFGELGISVPAPSFAVLVFWIF